MMNMMNMMKQAQNIQKRLKEAQDELNKMDISGEAANGSVKVICDGKGLFKSIKLSAEAINPEKPIFSFRRYYRNVRRYYYYSY